MDKIHQMLTYQFFAKSNPEDLLIVLIHGRSGTAQVMHAFKSVLPEGANIVSVEAPLPDPEGGFRWWHFGTSLELSEQSNSDASSAAATLKEWLSQFLQIENLKPFKIFAVGFSQGAALLSYIAQSDPSLFSKIAMLAGFVVEAKHDTNQGKIAKDKPKVFMAHGTKDDIVPLEKAQEGYRFLQNQGYEVSFISDEVGHKIGIGGMKALKSWLIES